MTNESESSSEARFEAWSKSYFPPVLQDQRWISEVDANHAWKASEEYWSKRYEEMVSDRDSETRWAKQYFEERNKLETKVALMEKVVEAAKNLCAEDGLNKNNLDALDWAMEDLETLKAK